MPRIVLNPRFKRKGEADTVAPVVGGIQAINITNTSFVVSWTTDEPSTSQVDYGTTTGYSLGPTTLDPTLTRTHLVTLSSLSPSTLYHYRVRSKDQAGNEIVGGDNTQTTSASGVDTTPPVISNVTAQVLSSSSVVISWDIDEPGTGQVAYGLTTAYGQLSALEGSFTYQHHIQQIDSLAAGTTYHFQCRSRDASGNLGVSADFNFTTQGVIPPATYPSSIALSHPAVNGDGMPGYLAEITDSTFGVKIRRISNTQGVRNQYSTAQSWNLDGTRIMFPGYGSRILNGTTYADLGAMATGEDMVHWSNLHADYAYGINLSSNKVRRYSVQTNAWTDRHTFSSYTGVDLGGYDGNVSDNDRMALIYSAAGPTRGIVVYDAENDAIISTKALTTYPNGSKISRSGNYVVVYYASVGGTGVEQGTWLYNASDMSTVRQLSQGTEHSDCGKDADGADIFVHITSGGDTPSANIIRSQRMASGTITDLLVVGQTVYGVGHISCANYDRPGWAYLSCNNTTLTTYDGNGMNVAVRTDVANQTTWEVFGFTHSTTDPGGGGGSYYNYTPLTSVSRDGSKVIYGSNWGGDPTTNTFCYVAGVTT